MNIAPWQVWWVDFGEPVGREQGYLRPGIVVGSELHCRFPIDMALMIPLTTRDRRLRHHIRISSPQSGLNKPGWAKTDDIRAMSTERFRNRTPTGVLSPSEQEDPAKASSTS